MKNQIINLLVKIGIKKKWEQIAVVTILAGFIAYAVGYNIGSFIAHIQNTLEIKGN